MNEIKIIYLGRWQKLLPISLTKTQVFTSNNNDNTISYNGEDDLTILILILTNDMMFKISLKQRITNNLL
jgi:hypothetical protein